MIDLDDLDDYDKMYVNGYFCRSDLKRLVERLRQAESEAKRYRWLKCKSGLNIEGIKFYEWDGFIDVAMQQKEGEES